MGRKPRDVTDAELAILQVLWDRGSATIRALTDARYPPGGPSDYATVKKLLARLESKGIVRRDASNMAHLFQATISQDDLIGRRLRHLAEDLCGGSRTPLLMHLIRNKDFTKKEREELHQAFTDLTRPNPKRST